MGQEMFAHTSHVYHAGVAVKRPLAVIAAADSKHAVQNALNGDVLYVRRTLTGDAGLLVARLVVGGLLGLGVLEMGLGVRKTLSDGLGSGVLFGHRLIR